MVFVHGHARAWHQQEEVTSKIQALNLTALSREHYISLRCNVSPGCEPNPDNANEKVLSHLPGFWSTLFPPPAGNESVNTGDPRQTGVYPDDVHAKCCAQFAVTRTAIESMSLDAWKRLRAPLLRELNEFDWGHTLDGASVGLLYEPIWHLFFGMGNA